MNIIINGQSIVTSGRNVVINNGVVFVDGKQVKDGLTESVEVVIEGDIHSINCNGNVTVKGNVTGNIDCNGNVNVGNDVGGDIDCNGNCNCRNVGGDIDAGGNVQYFR